VYSPIRRMIYRIKRVVKVD